MILSHIPTRFVHQPEPLVEDFIFAASADVQLQAFKAVFDMKFTAFLESQYSACGAVRADSCESAVLVEGAYKIVNIVIADIPVAESVHHAFFQAVFCECVIAVLRECVLVRDGLRYMVNAVKSAVWQMFNAVRP